VVSKVQGLLDLGMYQPPYEMGWLSSGIGNAYQDGSVRTRDIVNVNASRVYDEMGPLRLDQGIRAYLSGVRGSLGSLGLEKHREPQKDREQRIDRRREGGDPLGIPPRWVLPVHLLAGGIGIFLAWWVNEWLIEGQWVMGLSALCGYLIVMTYALSPILAPMFGMMTSVCCVFSRGHADTYVLPPQSPSGERQ